MTITFELMDDGSMDTVVRGLTLHGVVDVRFSTEEAAPYRDEDGALDFVGFLMDHREELEEAVREDLRGREAFYSA